MFSRRVASVSRPGTSSRSLARRCLALASLPLLACCGPAFADHDLRSLSAGFVPAGEIADFSNYEASPDGNWVVFEGCDDTACWLASERRDDPTDSAPVELGGPASTAAAITFEITADSRRVVFAAHPVPAGPRELWSVPIDGSTPPVRLHPALASAEDVRDFALTEDGAQAVFAIDDGDVGGWLKVAPTDGSGPATTLDEGEVDELLLFPAASGNPRVLYLIDSDGDGLLEISTAYLSSSLPFQLWAGELHEGFDLDDWRITPDGSRVVLQGDVFTAGVTELASIRTNAQNSFSRLNQGLVSGGEVESFRLGAGGRVVYRCDALVNNRHELWSVPADDSSPPIVLSGSLVDGGDVSNYSIAGDWVVYLADAAVDGQTELWSAPVEGGAAPTRRSAPLPAGREVEGFRVTPSATRLVYLANIEAADREDLYWTTVSGITGHVRLTNRNPFASFFYDVRLGFVISPDSAHVAFAVTPDAHFDGQVREQDLADPQVNAEILAVAQGVDSQFLSPRYLDPFGILFRAALAPADRVDLQLADARLFADGFESGDRTAWSAGTP